MLGSGTCTPPPAGLVSWWAGNGTAMDVAGMNNGVIIGAGFGAGEVGQAFSFNGTTQCVAIPYSRTLVATNYSVEAWVQPLTQVSDSISQDLIVGQGYGWHLVARTGTTGVGLAFGFGTSEVTFYDVVSTSELPIGQFSHVMGTWDGTTLRLYINGVLNAQTVPGATPVDLGYGVYIGGFRIESGASYFGQYFNGLIDEASYYRRALSSAEIQSLYSAGSAGKCRIGVPPSTPPQLRLRVSRNPDGTTRLEFAGNASTSYRIEVSTDMVNWVILGTCRADADGNVEFSDNDAAHLSPRFYRAAEQ